MDIKKLEIFLNLSKTMNYSETAAQLFTTQGNISKQIITLEKELGTSLVDRSHRQIKLTSAGKIVTQMAPKIVSEFQNMQQKIQQNKQYVDQLLRIVTVPSVANYRGLELIINFHMQYPEIKLDLTEVEGDHVLDTLKNGGTGVVFARDFGILQNQYDSVITEEDCFVCLLPKDHPLAHQKTVALADLSQENFLLLGRETMLYDHVINLTKKAGFEPRVSYDGRQLKIILNMIEKGIGIAIVMDKSVDLPSDGSIIKRPIDLSENSQMLFMRNYNVKYPKAVELFWNFLQTN
ncbi:LysR family transcriptional regulator [Weissella koreensis KACC 15510]|uniref:LysR family transcriptional regulator n=1 Tax=Weissella koreensis TaxID=165096 RepID=UPI000217477A|nr:LysR family transcriptional regulator [Weissella koreensis]AEJ23758.1 LysR family transcriptional regulator [Weissella koreensis KACC 15510]